MERRKTSNSKSSALPEDYLQMITEIFSAHFDAGLKLYGKIRTEPRFEARGEIFANEIVLAVSLVSSHDLSAATVHASSDFDPKASSPTVQDLLSACVDAIGTVFGSVLAPDQPEVIEQLAEESLAALENVPFDWVKLESNQREIFVKFDRSNPKLDVLADEWLKKHDPVIKEQLKEEEQETENLFVTGPNRKTSSGSGSGMSH